MMLDQATPDNEKIKVDENTFHKNISVSGTKDGGMKL